MTSREEEQFLKRVRDNLDNAPLDDITAERLAGARRRALNVLDTSGSLKPQNWSWFTWAPAGAFAMVLFVIAVTVSSQKTPDFPYYESELQAAAANEIDLLEELEFVAWMLLEESDAG